MLSSFNSMDPRLTAIDFQDPFNRLMAAHAPLEITEEPEERNWSEDRETLLQLSWLSSAAEHPAFPSPSDEMIDWISNRTLKKKIAPTKEQLDFLKDVWGCDIKPLEKGVALEEKMLEIIAKGKENFSEGQEELLIFSNQICAQVAALEEGESLFLFGATLASNGAGNNRIANALQDALISPEWKSSLEIENGAGLNELPSYIVEALAKELIDRIDRGLPSSLSSIVRSILNSGAPSLLPVHFKGGLCQKAVQIVLDSLKAHIKRDFLRSFPEKSRKHIDGFISNIVDIGMSAAIKKEIRKTSSVLKELLDEKLEKMQQDVLSSLADSSQSDFFLDLIGMKKSSGAIWLKVNREQEDGITLLIYGIGPCLDHHALQGEKKQQIALRYRLTHGELNAQFIYDFLTMRAWPLWNRELSFTPSSFYEGQLRQLDRFKVLGLEEDFCEQAMAKTITGPGRLLQLFACQKNNIPFSQIEQQLIYPVYKRWILSLWKEMQPLQPNQVVQRRLESVKTSLIKTSLELHKIGSIDEEELKAVYATAWQIDHRLRKTRQSEDFFGLPIDLNDALTRQIRRIVQAFGGAPHRLQAIEEALVEVFGPSMGETIRTALFHFSSQEEGVSANHFQEADGTSQAEGTSFYESISCASIKSYITAALRAMSDWDVWDWMFFLIRLIRQVQSFAYYLEGGMVVNAAVLSLHEGLMHHSPLYRSYPLLASQIARQAVNLAGVYLLEKYPPLSFVPRCVWEQCDSAIKKAEKKALYCAIVYTLPLLIPQNERQLIQSQVKRIEENFTREGELSFRLNSSASQDIRVSMLSKKIPLHLFNSEVQESSSLTHNEILNAQPLFFPVNLTPQNIAMTLSSWQSKIKEAQSFFNDRKEEVERKLAQEYVLRISESLPIPKSDRETLWDKIEDPEKMMQLLIEFQENYAKLKIQSSTKRHFIHSLRIYTIVDYLARKEKLKEDNRLSGFSTTPPILYLFLNKRFMYVEDVNLKKDLCDICAYFNLDPKHPYSGEDFKNARESAVVGWEYVFHAGSVSIETINRIFLAMRRSSISSHAMGGKESCFAGFRYLHHIQEAPKIREKLDPLDKRALKKLCYKQIGQDLPEASFDFELPELKKWALLLNDAFLPSSYRLLVRSYKILLESFYEGNTFNATKSFEYSILRANRKDLGDESWLSNALIKNHIFSPLLASFCYQKEEILLQDNRYGLFNTNLNEAYRSWKSIHFHFFWAGTHFSSKPQSQGEALNQDPHFAVEELITTDEETIVRLLGDLKKDPVYFCQGVHKFPYLWISLTSLDLLNRQLMQRQELVSTIGNTLCASVRFLIQTQDCAHRAIFHQLIRLTLLTRAVCEKTVPGSSSHFSTLRAILLDEFIPFEISRKKRSFRLSSGFDLLETALILLVLHEGEEPQMLSPEAQEDFVHDYCLYSAMMVQEKKCPFTTDLFRDRPFRSTLLFHEQLPFILAYLDNPAHQTKRDRILTQIALKMNMIKQEVLSALPLKWAGTFPSYRCGTIGLDLLACDDQQQKIALKKATAIRSQTSALLNRRVEDLYEREGHYFTSDCRIEIENGRIAIYKKGYRLIPPSFIDPARLPPGLFPRNAVVWLKMNSDGDAPEDHLIVESSYEQKCLKLPIEDVSNKHGIWDFKINTSRLQGADSIKEEVNLERHEHGLSLLSWFTPLNKIKAFFKSGQPDVLCRIELLEHGLQFNIQKGPDGKERAMCDGMLNGFFIAPKQKNLLLQPYTCYLLLQNDRGDKKVILPHTKIEQLMAQALLKQTNQKDIWDLPLVQHMLQRRWNASWEDHKKTYFIYSVDNQGRLESDDPQALILLIAHALARKDYGLARDLTGALERIGRLQAFPQAVAMQILPLAALSFFDKSALLLSICLRLIAMKEENALLPSDQKEVTDQTRANDQDKEGFGRQALFWLTTYCAYERYLEQGVDQILVLSEYQELLLIHGLIKTARLLLQEQISDTSLFRQISDRLGADEIISTLLLPNRIAQRERYLKKKHAAKGENRPNGTKIATALFKKYLVDRTNSPSIFGAQGTAALIGRETSSPLSYATKHLSIALANPSFEMKTADELCHVLDVKNWLGVINLKTPLREVLTVPLNRHDYTPCLFAKHFLSYYALASNSIPPFLKQNGEKRALFAAKRAQLASTLSQIHLKGSGRETILVEILKAVLRTRSHASLPGVVEIKESFANAHPEYPIALVCTLTDLCSFTLSCRRSEMMQDPARIAKVGCFIASISCDSTKNYAIYAAKQAAIRMISGPLGTAYQYYRWGKSGFSLLQAIREIYEDASPSPLSAAFCAPSWRSAYIQEELAQQMTHLDGYFDDILKAVLVSHFDPVAVRPPVATIEIPLSNPDHHLADWHVNHLNESCRQFDAREQEPLLHSILKGDLEKVVSTLDDLHLSLSNQLHKEREALIAYVNAPRVRKRQEIPSVREAIRRMDVRQQFPQQDEIQLRFDEILPLFLADNLEEWKRKTQLTDDKIIPVQEHLYLYLVKATRFQQLERCRTLARQAMQRANESSIASDDCFEELALELQKQRAYDLKQLPSRIVRAHLAFEWANGHLLWKKQAAQEDAMLLEEGKKIVAEMIMGSGKTHFGVPTTDFVIADGERAVFNFWPRAAAAMSTRLTARQGHKSFSQEAHFLSFCRSTPLALDTLLFIRQRIAHLRAHGGQINMVKESMQSLQLKMLLQAFEIVSIKKTSSRALLKEKKETLYHLAKILHFIRKTGVANLDEIHETLEQKAELNYSCGSASFVKKEWIQTIAQVIRCLLQTEQFKTILHIKEDQEPIEEDLYREKILPVTATKLVNKYCQNLPQNEKEEMVLYLCGKAQATPVYLIGNEDKAMFDLFKGTLSQLLPTALQQKPAEDFGPSKDIPYSRPYLACGRPNPQATIQSPFETIVKTFLSFLYTRIDAYQGRSLAQFMASQAKREAETRQIAYEETISARQFKKWLPGFKLSNWESVPIETFASLASSDEAVLHYAALASQRIRYFKKNIKCDSQNFASMFSSFFGDSGSLHNHHTYPKGAKIIWDKGTQGETKHLMQIKQTVGSIQILEKEKPQQIVDEILERFFAPQSRKSAIIDRGGLFRGLSNEAVAKRMLTWVQQTRPDLKGVIFYDENDCLKILEAGSDNPISLEESKLAVGERITFFDQFHTFASDVPQNADAEAVLTIADTKLEEFSQAAWRMRGLKRKQSITVVMSEKTKNKITAEQVPTIEDIYAFVTKNEAHALLKDHFESDRKQIRDVVRRSILDKMFSVFDDLEESTASFQWNDPLASAIDRLLSYFEEFSSVFISEDSDDPRDIFGGIDAYVHPKPLLEHYMAHQFSIIEKSRSFSTEEKKAIWIEMKDLANGLYPEKVHVYLKEGEPDHSAQDSFGKEQVSETSAENQRDEQKEQQEQTELQQQRDVQKEPRPRILHYWHPSIVWNSSIDPFALEWLKYTDVDGEHHPLAQSLQEARRCAANTIENAQTSILDGFFAPYRCFGTTNRAILSPSKKDLFSQTAHLPPDQAGVPLYLLGDILSKKAQSELWQRAAKAFDAPLFCSHNFCPVVQQGLFGKEMHPFANNRKPLSELLVIETRAAGEESRYCVGMIDHSDVTFWREKILSSQSSSSHVRIAIYQVHLKALIAASDDSWKSDELNLQPAFLRALVQAKLYHLFFAYSEPEQAALKAWLKGCHFLAVKEAFLELVDLYQKDCQYQKSDIAFVFDEIENDFLSPHLEAI